MATFPNLLTPLTPQGLIDVGLKDNPYDLSKLYDATNRVATVPKSTGAKSAATEKEDDKIIGLPGARTATYNAIQAAESKLASLYSTFGEQAATLPQAAEITGQIKRLKSNYQYEGLKFNQDQYNTMRDATDKAQAGDYFNMTAFKESGGRDNLTNNQVLDYHQNEYTTDVGGNNRRYGWNVTTAKEQDANDAVAKIFEPAEQMMIKNSTSGLSAKNYGDIYGIRTYHKDWGNNHVAVNQAASQVYEQAGFKMEARKDKNGKVVVDENDKVVLDPVLDKNGNPVLDMGIALSEAAPFAGYMVSFGNSIRGDKSYYDKDGNLKEDKFSADYADFVQRRVQLEWNKRLQNFNEERSSFSESNEITARMGEEKKIIAEINAPPVSFTATIEGKSSAWSENSLVNNPNGIGNILGYAQIPSDVAMRVLRGEGTAEEKALFLNSPKSPEVLELAKGAKIGGIDWELVQAAHNKAIIDKSVQFGILEKTTDDNGKIAYVSNPRAEENITKQLNDNANKKADDPTRLSVQEQNTLVVMQQRATAAGNANKVIADVIPQTATTSHFNNVDAAFRETPSLSKFLRESITQQGNNSAETYFSKNVAYSNGLPTLFDFSGTSATIIDVGNEQVLMPERAATNFGTVKDPNGNLVKGYWKKKSTGELYWTKDGDVENYDMSGKGYNPLTPDMDEYKWRTEYQKANPTDIRRSNAVAAYTFTTKMTVDEYEQFKKKNYTLSLSTHQVAVDKKLVNKEIEEMGKKGLTDLPAHYSNKGTRITSANTYEGGTIKQHSADVFVSRYGLREEDAVIASSITNPTQRTNYVAQARINKGTTKYTEGAKPQSQRIALTGHPDYDYNSKSESKKATLVEENGKKYVLLKVTADTKPYISGKIAGMGAEAQKSAQKIVNDGNGLYGTQQTQQTKGQQTGRLQNPTQPNNNVSGFR